MSEPKTDAGKRTIPMTETVHRAFVELRKQNLILGRRSDAEVGGYSSFERTEKEVQRMDNVINF